MKKYELTSDTKIVFGHILYTDDGFYTDCDCIPTHWMPLPESQKEGCDTNGEAKKYTAEEIKELAKKAFEA